MSGVGKQFEQLPLFGDHIPSLQPHQMSPERFSDDPMTVFHSSFLRNPTAHHYPSDEHPGFHAGTEQSALERIAVKGPYFPGSNHDDALLADPVNRRSAVHRYHLRSVDRLDNPMSDEEANDRDVVHFLKSPTAYRNIHEDEGSLSVVAPTPMRLGARQSEFVGAAIQEGRKHEVHPRTLALYEKGVLDTYDLHDPETAQKQVWRDAASSDRLFPYQVRSTKRPVSREEIAEHASPESRERFLNESYDDPVGAASMEVHDDTWKRFESQNGKSWMSPGTRLRARVSDRGDVGRAHP